MRVVISRIVAPIIAALVAWLTSMGLDLDPGFGAALTEATTWFLLALFGVLYGVLHKLIDRKLNPIDSAVKPSDPRINRGRLLAFLLLFPAAALVGCGDEPERDARPGGGGGDYPAADSLDESAPLEPADER